MYLFLLALAAVAGLLQWYTLRKGFQGITRSLRLSTPTAEPDEEFEIVTQVTNGTRRFIPFIRMHEALPPDMAVTTPGVNADEKYSGMQHMVCSLYLMPRQKLVRRVRATLPNRGRYFFRGARMYLGDFLGFYEIQTSFNETREIVVIPRRCESIDVEDTFGGFLGDISVNRFILEDPVLTLGFREYTMREPLKMISWTQSARTGQLMVKKYDYTLELNVTVLLNVEGGSGDGRPGLIEACYSIARTVCELLEQRGIQYDFLTNANASGAVSLWDNVGQGLGQRHLMTILEGLGRATYECTMPFSRLLDGLTRKAANGRSYVVITPCKSPKLENGLTNLRDIAGGQICLISAEEVVQ